MKRLLLTFIAVFILLGQQGSFDHAFHDHEAGEICDFCLHSKALDHFAENAIPTIAHTYHLQQQVEIALAIFYKNHTNYFTARAPPRFI